MSMRQGRDQRLRPSISATCSATTGSKPWICSWIHDIPVQEEVSQRGTNLGEFGVITVKGVWNACERVQFRGDFGISQQLQHMQAAVRRHGSIRQTVVEDCGRVSRFDPVDRAGSL